MMRFFFIFLHAICFCLPILKADQHVLKYTHLSLIKQNDVCPYKLAICTIFRNDALYLKEWIEFHKLVGVEHFYLYSNLSTDHYFDVLYPYITSGEVELFEWPYESANVQEWTPIQCSAYEDAVRRACFQTKWLAILDSDEFLMPAEGSSLVDTLKPYEAYGGVVVNWQMYGTSNVAQIGQDELMVERLILKAPVGYGENQFVKSIVHPECVERITDPHFVHYKEGFFQVNTNKETAKGSIAHSVLIDRLRLNHYWSRDEWFFYQFKCPRRQKWSEGFDGQLNRLNAINQEADFCMERFIPALKKAMGFNP